MLIAELVFGLVLLLAGGEALVRGAVSVATRFGVSPLVIGLTLVGFGTSTPELVASIDAALLGAPGIAIGNVVGSNIANVLLILGVSAVLYPIAVAPGLLRRDGVVLIVVSLIMVAIVLSGLLGRVVGVLLIVTLLAYTLGSFWLARRERSAAEEEVEGGWPRNPVAALALALAGIAGVVIGADYLVASAIEIARIAGLSEAVIGLTIVAVGTSLPELVTSVMAAVRKHSDVALGNVVGSNIFNVLGIAGATALVAPIPVPPEIARLDVWVMLGAAVALIVFALGGRINRWEGALLLGLYGLYLFAQFSPAVRASLGLA